MTLYNVLPLLADATQATGNGGAEELGFWGQWGSLIMIVGIFVVMYFLMIRPQKKQQKEEKKMRDSLRKGDDITTIGGIVSTVLNVKEDTLIIETGGDRNKMTIKKWAVQSCETVHDDPVEDDDDLDDDE